MNFNGHDVTDILDMVRRGSVDIIDVNEWFYRKSIELNDKINSIEKNLKDYLLSNIDQENTKKG
ncbi:hypothetical protein [Desulfurella sp.]|uniref:hypothetical protein n=1 Tax=Desulfurella sp. TaxID=1962857 RepID=UPI0025B80421|nr:hypothetical protein [Desulfurella sp.]